MKKNKITLISMELQDEAELLKNHGYGAKIKELEVLSKLQETNPSIEIDTINHNYWNTEELQNVLSLIPDMNNDKIIITHSIDTIVLAAKALSETKNKTIVLTGAMMPEKPKESDVDFNIGMAMGAVQLMPHGIYVALHGELKNWKDFVG